MSQHRTPWTNSHLPSDRLKPRPSPQAAKGKNAKSAEAKPKSKEVLRLEKQLKDLLSASGNEKDPKGGCFCLAREHALSRYNPVCVHCGLVLCFVNLPHFCCPHCLSPLLSETQRSSLKASIETEISQVLAKEQEAREAALERARQETGAFPALVSQSSSRPPARQAHVVLSIDSRAKKATILTSKSSSQSASRTDSEDDLPVRVPPPTLTLYTTKRDPDRPWLDLSGNAVKYIPSVQNEKPNKHQNKRKKHSKET